MPYQIETHKHLTLARRNTIWVTAFICALIFMPLWWFSGLKYKEYLFAKQRNQDTLELSLLRNSLRVSISKRLALLEGLSAFAESNPKENLLDAGHEAFMAGLYISVEGIRNFALAPDGIMRYVHPLKGNENVPGHDLINDKRPNVRVDVQRTIKTGKAVLSGPYELRQGGLGLVARKAIFVDNSFWGLATMVIDMPPVFKEAGLLVKPSDIQVALRDKAGNVFYGENDVFQTQPLIMQVHLLDGENWELAGIPVGGWYISIKKDFYFFQATSLLIVCLLTILTYTLINRQKLLQMEVNYKTDELHKWWHIFKNAEWGVALEMANKKTIELMNPAFAKMHGYSVDELTGKEISKLFLSDFQSELPAIIHKCHELGHHTFEADHIRKDGTTFPAYHDVTTVKDNKGTVLYRIVNVQDISDRKRDEEELKKYRDHLEEMVKERTFELSGANEALLDSENRYRSLSDAAFEGIAISEKGAFLEVNNAMVKMFGYQSTELIGMEAVKLVVPDMRQAVQDKVLSGYENIYETVGVKKDGTKFPVEVHGRIFSYKGQQVRVSAIRDLTERKKTEEALLESERMQGVLEIAGAVCHEINQPLMAITGFSELLLINISQDDPSHEKITKIVEQTEKLGGITRKLMNITRYETKEYLKSKIVDIDKSSKQSI